MKHTLRIFLFILVVHFGTAPATVAQSTINGSFMHDGVQRDYILYVPAIYNGTTPVPLVFNLHGYTSDNVQQAFYADFRPIADTANFIIALPNGTLDPVGNRYWDTFGLGAVDDLGFLGALLDSISATYQIDADRVYSTGMSNGGFMSYDLACFLSDRITAIASVTGSMLNARLLNCAATHTTPVMQIHGTADPTVNYNGGSGVSSIEGLVASWAQFNNCDPTPMITAVPNINSTDGCTAEHYLYTGGDAGSTVEFFKVLGGGHTWPGSPFVIGVTNQDFNACREIWRFFSQYEMGQLTGIEARVRPEGTVNIAPNPSSAAFRIQFEQPMDRTITVTDVSGKLIRTMKTAGTMVQLNMDEQGVYVVVIRDRTRTTTHRLVKL